MMRFAVLLPSCSRVATAATQNWATSLIANIARRNCSCFPTTAYFLPHTHGAVLLKNKDLVQCRKKTAVPSGRRNLCSSSARERDDGKSEKWFGLSKENQTIPNYITFARIFASPGLTYAVMNDMKMWALGGCIVFAVTDWLDGYIAKNYNQMSTLGAYLDPLADKVMIGSLSVGLMYQNLLPLPLVGVILGRDMFLLTMSFIIRAIDKPPGAPFFETTKTSTFEVIPSEISKVSVSINLSHT